MSILDQINKSVRQVRIATEYGAIRSISNELYNVRLDSGAFLYNLNGPDGLVLNDRISLSLIDKSYVIIGKIKQDIYSEQEVLV